MAVDRQYGQAGDLVANPLPACGVGGQYCRH
jgi:hypothetical protein